MDELGEKSYQDSSYSSFLVLVHNFFLQILVLRDTPDEITSYLLRLEDPILPKHTILDSPIEPKFVDT